MKLTNSLEPEFSIKKDAGTNGFTEKFYKYLRKLISILPKLFPKIKETTIPNSFMESRIILISNSNKTQERKL